MEKLTELLEFMRQNSKYIPEPARADVMQRVTDWMSYETRNFEDGYIQQQLTYLQRLVDLIKVDNMLEAL